jgi:hypothetical protein
VKSQPAAAGRTSQTTYSACRESRMQACIRTLFFSSADRNGLRARAASRQKGVTMAFWSWLDVPFAVLVLAAARGIPLWLDQKKAVAASGLVAMAVADLGPLGFESAGLAESDERLADAGCVADRSQPQEWVEPQLTRCPQCGLPAEIRDRFCLESTDGPVDHVALSCIDGHHFRMAADRLADEPVVPARVRTSKQPMTW